MLKKLIVVFAGVLVSCGSTECITGGCDGVDTTTVWTPKEYAYRQLGETPEKQSSKIYIVPSDFVIPNGWKIFDQTPYTMSFEIVGERNTLETFYIKYPTSEYNLAQYRYKAAIFPILDENTANTKDIKSYVIVTKN